MTLAHGRREVLVRVPKDAPDWRAWLLSLDRLIGETGEWIEAIEAPARVCHELFMVALQHDPDVPFDTSQFEIDGHLRDQVRLWVSPL